MKWHWTVTLSGYDDDGNKVFGYRFGDARKEDTARRRALDAKRELENKIVVRMPA
jgi:hypothetical protein